MEKEELNELEYYRKQLINIEMQLKYTSLGLEDQEATRLKLMYAKKGIKSAMCKIIAEEVRKNGGRKL